MLDAHGQTQGEGVIIAVIDTGVDGNHPDLHRNVLPGIDVVPGGTGNGRGDADGHGTGMAGLVAAHGHGEGDGALGLAPRAKILPVRITTSSRVGDTNDLARGIEWAIGNGADIICVPNGGGTTVDLLRAVNLAIARDVVVVAAGGNKPPNVAVLSPARFPGVIAVAAVDKGGVHVEQSVTGPQIAISAPGTDIVSTGLRGQHRRGTGTSDAAAIVAGAAALVRAKYPNLTADQVVQRLTATATDKGPPGRDEQYGYGVLNLVAALSADIPTPSPTGGTTRAAPTSTPTDGGPRQGLLPVALVALALAVVLGVAATVITRRRQRRTSR